MANEIICKGCPHNSEREELFNTITVFVKNKKNLNEALHHFI